MHTKITHVVKLCVEGKPVPDADIKFLVGYISRLEHIAWAAEDYLAASTPLHNDLTLAVGKLNDREDAFVEERDYDSKR